MPEWRTRVLGMVLQTHRTQNHPESSPDETGYHRKELTSENKVIRKIRNRVFYFKLKCLMKLNGPFNQTYFLTIENFPSPLFQILETFFSPHGVF